MDNRTNTLGVRVLDKGALNLINFMGGDAAVVASARVSNGVSYEDASKGEEKDSKLINYLMKHRHGTPFEHSVFTFYVKAPLFVVREWQRHRIGSFNEISGRYVEFEPEFYTPTTFRVPGDTNKQGSKYPEGGLDDWYGWHYNISETVLSATMYAYETYRNLLESGVAKEMARMVLPLNLYSQFYWTVNARSLMNFISLRSSEDAQWEIREYAQLVESLFRSTMPITSEAFIVNNRMAP